MLEDAGLKLTTVASDAMGASGRAMLTALVEGTTDPGILADLARGKLRKKLPLLQRALQGKFRPHHAFLIHQGLAKIDFLDEAIEHLTAELDRRLSPFEPMLANLDTIPGIDRIGASKGRLAWWRRREATCSDLRPPGISVAGARSVPATTRVRANGGAGRPGKGIAICALR